MQGRCACGLVDSVRKVELHTVQCPAYATLYHQDPVHCPNPAALYRQYQQEHDPSQERATRRDIRLSQRFVELDRAHALHRRRWATPADILDD